MSDLWIQHIPVISTDHMPGPNALLDIENMVAPYEYGGFVYVGEGSGLPAWLEPITAWLRQQGLDDGWVRIDAEGDVIDGLPTYEWGDTSCLN